MSSSVTPDPEQLLADRAWLVRMASALLDHREDAEDVAQEAQLRAWSKPPRDGERRPWLRRVTQNLASRLRMRGEWRLRWERRGAQSEAQPSAADLVARAQAQRAIADAVLALAEPYRSVVLLRFFDDVKTGEIARRLGLPVETVRTRLKRALSQLRTRLDSAHGGRDVWCAMLAPWVGVAKAGSGAKALLAAGVVVAGWIAWKGASGAMRELGSATTIPGEPTTASLDVGEPARIDASVAESSSRVENGAERSIELVTRGGIVHVVDDDGRPIEGAHLFVGPRGSAETRCVTDRDGRARLPDSIAESWMAVAAKGWRLVEQALRPSRPFEFDVVLQPAATIEGTVQTSDPLEVRGGMRVAAIAREGPCGAAHFDAICSGRAPGPVSTSDEIGAFKIEGLEPGRAYTIVAGGHGFASVRLDEVEAGSKGVVVTIGALYGLDVQLRQRGGASLPASDWFGPARRLEQGQPDVVTDDFRKIVAGIPAAQRAWNRDHFLMLHVRESCPDERIGPFVLTFEEAGFASSREYLQIERFTDAVPVATVELEPLAEVAFGRLTIDVQGEESALAGVASRELLGVLRLFPQEHVGASGLFETGIYVGRGARQVIRGIPAVPYRWSFCTLSSKNGLTFLNAPMDEPAIEFREGDASVVVDLRDYGDVEFDVFRPDGAAAVGAISVDIQKETEDPDPKSRWQFARNTTLDDPPYVVRVLRAGRYRARLRVEPSSRRPLSGADDSSMVEFEVKGGACVRCRGVLVGS